MMNVEVKAALDAMLEGVSRKDLQARAERISQAYRAGKGSAVAIRDDGDALAYAVARMPATLAAIDAASRAAFGPGRLPAELETGGPRTLLDLGAGPGTATLALLAPSGSAVEPPQYDQVTLVETHPAFRALAAELLRRQRVPYRIHDATIGELPSTLAPARLVVMSYVQVEMTAANAAIAVGEAARLARSRILLVEPGTPLGFQRIRAARDLLLAMGFAPTGPCPGAMTCPMQAGDWCHFSVRLARSRDHKLLKRADAPFEDERYCYFAAVRGPARPASARILAEPERTRGGITARLCTTAGVESRTFKRSDKARYAFARGLRWGDAIEAQE